MIEKICPECGYMIRREAYLKGNGVSIFSPHTTYEGKAPRAKLKQLREKSGYLTETKSSGGLTDAEEKD